MPTKIWTADADFDISQAAVDGNARLKKDGKVELDLWDDVFQDVLDTTHWNQGTQGPWSAPDSYSITKQNGKLRITISGGLGRSWGVGSILTFPGDFSIEVEWSRVLNLGRLYCYFHGWYDANNRVFICHQNVEDRYVGGTTVAGSLTQTAYPKVTNSGRMRLRRVGTSLYCEIYDAGWQTVHSYTGATSIGPLSMTLIAYLSVLETGDGYIEFDNFTQNSGNVYWDDSPVARLIESGKTYSLSAGDGQTFTKLTNFQKTTTEPVGTSQKNRINCNDTGAWPDSGDANWSAWLATLDDVTLANYTGKKYIFIESQHNSDGYGNPILGQASLEYRTEAPRFEGFQLADEAVQMPKFRGFTIADQNPHVYEVALDGSREFTSISTAIAALVAAQAGNPITTNKYILICDNGDYTSEGNIDFYHNIGGAADDKRIYLEPLPGYRPKISSVLGSHWVTVQDLDIEGPATLVYARYLNGFNLFSCRLIRTGASGGYGYYRAYEGSLCKVYNNFFIGDFYAAMSTDVINDELCFNSIYLAGTGSGKGIGGYRGIIKNNIVYCDSASKVCFTNVQSKWPNLDMNYNCFYHPLGNIGSYYDGANWISITNLSAWQTLSGKDLNSVEVDPVYIDPGNNDLHLHITSPLKGFRGTPITGVTADHDGDIRDEYFPAIGADEIIRAGGILTMKSKYW